MANDLVFTILGIDKGSDAFDKVSKSADRFGDSLSRASKMGAIALGAMPVAAMAAGVASAGAFALVGAGVVGLSALILHNNEQVGRAYGGLWQSISEGATAAAQPMAKDLTLAADQARFAVHDLTPEFNKLFAAAGPDVEYLTQGVVGFAKNAMPGFVTAVKSSGPALDGLSSLMKSTGTGVTDFFTNMSSGAASSGQIMDTTGHIVRDFMGFAGSLFAQLANTGSPAVMALEGALRQAEGTILSLGSTSFPGLTTAASGFLTAGSGVLRLLQLLSPILGPLISDAALFATSLKLIDTVSFGAVSAGIGSVKTAMKEAEGMGGKLKAGMGALATGPLPLLGIAAVGLSLILNGLGQKQREAAEAAKIHADVVRDLAGTLDKTTGSIGDETRAWVANKIAHENVGKAGSTMADQAQHLGIAQSQVANAVLNTNNALGTMDGSLRQTIQSQIQAKVSSQDLERIHQLTGKSLSDLITIYMSGGGAVDDFQSQLDRLEQTEGTGMDGLSGLGQAMQGATLDARNLWGGISELHSGLTDAQKQALQAAQALGLMTPAEKEAQAEAGKLKTAYTTLGDSMKSVADKGAAVLLILDKMAGKSPDLREAQKAWDDLMRSLDKKTDWDSTKDGVQKLTDSLVDMRGEVNTTTEAGSKLQEWAKNSANDFVNQGAAMKAAGRPADEMSAKLTTMRQQFIDNAVAQGLSKEAANRLADAYGLIPTKVSTLIETPNLAQKMQEVGLFGQQVQNLPDGTVEVFANTDTARGQITKLIQDTNGKVITLHVVGVGATQTVRNMGGGLPAAASGTDFAPGGLMLVGEEGPEVMEVPRGARIHDAVKTAHMMSPGGRSITPLVVSEAKTVVHKHYHLTVQSMTSEKSLRDQFRDMELMAGV